MGLEQFAYGFLNKSFNENADGALCSRLWHFHLHCARVCLSVCLFVGSNVCVLYVLSLPNGLACAALSVLSAANRLITQRLRPSAFDCQTCRKHHRGTKQGLKIKERKEKMTGEEEVLGQTGGVSQASPSPGRGRQLISAQPQLWVASRRDVGWTRFPSPFEGSSENLRAGICLESCSFYLPQQTYENGCRSERPD